MTRTRKTWTRGPLAAALMLCLTAVTLTSTGTEAEAATTTDFDPAMIITDALFYDADSMTAAQVQSFLNAQVPVCLDGDLTNDVTCLKDYRTSTVAKDQRTSNGAVLCEAIRERAATAAEVIDIVARACGVSQKALLVTLQKEQGLVTHTDPGQSRLDRAMGYACPDTPGVGCDSQYYGFFNQVYNAALQFKRYQANPGNYGYRSGVTNFIQYKPNTTCGTTAVVIRNQATAGLYNYTPYVPNQAALNAGYGTGDSCSSYGNRNFFNFYTDWFGPTTGYPVSGGIAAHWQSLGGAAAIGQGDPALQPRSPASLGRHPRRRPRS